MSIRALRLRRVSLRLFAAVSLSASALAFLSCQTILGIHDVELALEPTDQFDLTIGPATVGLVYGSSVSVPVTVTPHHGFNGTVQVTTTSIDPEDLDTGPPLVLQGGGTGTLQLDAVRKLGPGSRFPLVLVATSGTLEATATAPAVVQGASGTLDPSFGTMGIVSWLLAGNDGETRAVLPAPDTKILVGGDEGDGGPKTLTGRRLTPNGGVDPTFGDAGQVSYVPSGVTGYGAQVTALAVTPDGVALFVGWAARLASNNADVVLQRYYEDGGAPENVGNDKGLAITDLGGSEEVSAGALMTDQRIVIGGNRNHQLYAARFADRFGTLDTTFAGDGWISPLPVSANASAATAVAVDSQDRVVLAGSLSNGVDLDVVLLRLTAAGILDGGFGKGGVVLVPLPGDQTPGSVAVQADGAIVVAARDDGSSGGDAGTRPAGMLVFRFTDAGTPDPTFGLAPGGTVTIAAAVTPTPVTAALTPDGRIVVAGSTGNALLARLLSDGTPDATYGSMGVAQPDVDGQVSVNAIAFAADGTLLLCGNRVDMKSGTDGFVARVFN